MSLPSPLLVATSNAGKLAEWRILLGGLGIELRPWPGRAPEEDAGSVEGNARIKALSAARQAGVPALGDDVGLWVEALLGAPGLELRRWADALGGWGPAKQALQAQADGSAATYRCGVALAWPDGATLTAVGVLEGRIAEGLGPGPGLQPCFRPLVPPDTPRGIAPHRALALRALLGALGR
ncbi:MAG TPA: non-canonical purine NTP pyrophosphatase [Deltaproteobacteria bacterium]|nr:non-canonical purine NTP pyrophosphatase [Deltaproteobacteria bacterium]